MGFRLALPVEESAHISYLLLGVFITLCRCHVARVCVARLGVSPSSHYLIYALEIDEPSRNNGHEMVEPSLFYISVTSDTDCSRILVVVPGTVLLLLLLLFLPEHHLQESRLKVFRQDKTTFVLEWCVESIGVSDVSLSFPPGDFLLALLSRNKGYRIGEGGRFWGVGSVVVAELMLLLFMELTHFSLCGSRVGPRAMWRCAERSEGE